MKIFSSALLSCFLLCVSFMSCDKAGENRTYQWKSVTNEGESSKEELRTDAYGDQDIQAAPQGTYTLNNNQAPPRENQVIPKQAMLISTADIRMRVVSFDSVAGNIKAILRRYDAYLANARDNMEADQKTAVWTIRVDNKHFETVLDQLAAQAVHLHFKDVKVDDVSEEYIDVKSRLKAKEALEARYFELLKQAKTIKDMLEIEQKIREVREEIDAANGRLQFLLDRVQYSTINLEFYQWLNPKKEIARTNFLQKAGKAFVNGLEGVGSVFIALITLWPLWILLAAVFYFVRYVRQTRKARNI